MKFIFSFTAVISFAILLMNMTYKILNKIDFFIEHEGPSLKNLPGLPAMSYSLRAFIFSINDIAANSHTNTIHG